MLLASRFKFYILVELLDSMTLKLLHVVFQININEVNAILFLLLLVLLVMGIFVIAL
jgi:hypothetical protein